MAKKNFAREIRRIQQSINQGKVHFNKGLQRLEDLEAQIQTNMKNIEAIHKARRKQTGAGIQIVKHAKQRLEKISGS